MSVYVVDEVLALPALPLAVPMCFRVYQIFEVELPQFLLSTHVNSVYNHAQHTCQVSFHRLGFQKVSPYLLMYSIV